MDSKEDKPSSNEDSQSVESIPPEKKFKFDERDSEEKTDSMTPGHSQSGSVEHNNEVEYLCSPTKLNVDTKAYRTIRLKNGFTALLISTIITPNTNEGPEHCNSNTSNQNANENRKTIFANKYQGETAAVCSLCINVGSFSDPPNIQGLAHLLEHMVSMGSKKYPKENDYDQFIHQKWGTSNAVTEPEQTTFSFEISEKYLRETMDRFAHLFIDPLITIDAVTRECQSIENECKLAQQLDINRKIQLKRNLIRNDHPASKFSWGNLNSLCHNVSINELQSELHKFRNRHYSAHRMTFVIQAAKSLDALEQLVKECFSDVPVNYLPPVDFSPHTGVDSFDTSKFQKYYKIRTIKDISEVELSWVMPPMQHLYKSKPWEYVFWLLSSPGEGSLYDYLRKKMWCLEIYNGSDEGFEHTSMYFLFSLSLVLTEEGFKNIDRILCLIFSYINLLQEKGIQKRIFTSMRRIKEQDFRYEFLNNDENVDKIAQNMQHYSPADYLLGYDLIFEYDYQSIKNCLDVLKPEDVNIIISSKHYTLKELNSTEPCFGTKYSSGVIPKDCIEFLKSIETHSAFSLEAKEVYSSNSLDNGKNILTIEHSYPVKIHHDDYTEIWSQSETSHFTLCLHLISPISYETALQASLLNLLLVILDHMTKTFVNDDTKLNLSIKGITIESFGSEKEAVVTLIHKVLLLLINCHNKITESLFNMAKKETLKMFYNNFIDPEKLNQEVLLSLTASVFWTSVEKYNSLNKVTYTQFLSYAEKFSKQFFIQAFVKGIFESDRDAICSIYDCVRPLFRNSYISFNFPPIKTYKFDLGERCCQIKNFNRLDSNSVIRNYYQIGVASQKFAVIFELLAWIMDEPLFNALRTKEQLGYKVTSELIYFHGVISFAISVIFPANKFTADYVDERIANFIDQFKNILKEMPNHEFECIKENYIKLKLKDEKEDMNKHCTNWGEIVMGENIFNRNQQMIKIVKDLTIDDLYNSFNEYVIDGVNYRKLSVQIVGSSNATNEDKADTSKTVRYSIIYSPEVPLDKKQELGEDYYINDLKSYRQNLRSYVIKKRLYVQM